MKILLLISEMWNDKTYPNNNMTNWFTDFENADIATITLGAGNPYNGCCKKYFRVSDNMMLKSLFFGKKAGEIIEYDEFPNVKEENTGSVITKKKHIHLELVRLIRDIIWRYGRYDLNKLKTFINNFNPDIIFSQRYGSVKMCRLEKIVSSITDAPMVAYTGDDEYSLSRLTFNPIFWIRRLWTRSWLKRRIPNYKLYYSMSYNQMKFYSDKFGIETKLLVKCGNFDFNKVHTSVNKPVKIVYAGKLYCGRWKTLAMIADEIRKINSDGVKVILKIYTGDRISKKQNILLNDGFNSEIMGFVSAVELNNIYEKTDIALHVEGLGLKDRLITRHSFSTKIMDLLSSGCAVMAVCHSEQAGYEYLKNKDIALTADNRYMINALLNKISIDCDIITDYARKAFEFGVINHSRKKIQRDIYYDFQRVINKGCNENCFS